jgi:hypothetical protein
VAKRSAHSSPKGQRLDAKDVLWRPFCKEGTSGGRWPLIRAGAEFSGAFVAGCERTAGGRSEDATPGARVPDKGWFRVGGWLTRVAGLVGCDVLTPSLLFSGDLSKASSKRYFLKKRRSDDDRSARR